MTTAVSHFNAVLFVLLAATAVAGIAVRPAAGTEPTVASFELIDAAANQRYRAGDSQPEPAANAADEPLVSFNFRFAPWESEETVNLLRDMLRLSQSAILVQARARLETVTIEPINIPPEAALQIALSN